jgi:diguanylate cyclase (GGDEF)-like protein
MKKIETMKELRSLVSVLPLLPYILFGIGIILGWRFNNAGLILTCVAMGLTYFTILDGADRAIDAFYTRMPLSETAGILLPLNVAFFGTITRRRLLTPIGFLCVGLIFFQAILILLFYQTLASPLPLLILDGKATWPLLYRLLADCAESLASWLQHEAFFGFSNISILAGFSFGAAFTLLTLRFARKRDSLFAGFLLSLVAGFLGLFGDRVIPDGVVYFSVAGLIILYSAVDASFSMAYLDELTSLPARRSLNNELLNLRRKYAIAMIDIDHFKKFNDRYGHKTGDQVLKMIAGHLKNITGGAKVFRYGGEEFTAIFPGKKADQALPHLEMYRKAIESTPFVIRGSERRVRLTDGGGKTLSDRRMQAKVTVSIGVAAPNKDTTTPEKVLREADKMLYKAKKGGRNRIAL